MTKRDKYYAKVANAIMAGSVPLRSGWQMLDDCENPEIHEYLSLGMNLAIYENSPEHIRLRELCSKFDTEEIHRVQIF